MIKKWKIKYCHLSEARNLSPIGGRIVVGKSHWQELRTVSCHSGSPFLLGQRYQIPRSDRYHAKSFNFYSFFKLQLLWRSRKGESFLIYKSWPIIPLLLLLLLSSTPSSSFSTDFRVFRVNDLFFLRVCCWVLVNSR